MSDSDLDLRTLESMDEAAVEAALPTLTTAELEVLLRRANREYWDNDAPTLTDPLYDRLVERMRKLDPEAVVLGEMGPSPSEGPKLDADEAIRLAPAERFGATVVHKRPMLSLGKCYNEADLLAWAAKINGDFVVMPKMDGIACSLRYDSAGALVLAATRGSGTEGEDITVNVLAIADVPSKIATEHAMGVEVEVRGELYMRLSHFEFYKAEHSHPRNLTAGSVKQKDPSKSRAHHLSFFPYDVIGPQLADERAKFDFLATAGFRVEGFEIATKDELQATFERFVRDRPSLDYEIDGVVYRASLTAEHARLGETGHHPRYAIAYKFQGVVGHTELLDVLWSVSRNGTITPVAILEPLELSGAMIGRASLHNINRFEELGLTRGCKVEVSRRGGVIPQVEGVAEPGPGAVPYVVPTVCPACGGPVDRRKKREGEFLWCANPKNCAQARLRELEHFAKVIDIQGFGPKIVAQAVDAGLLSGPVDFYRLRAVDLAGLDRLGERSAKRLIDQVDSHREVPLPTFLKSLGIEHLGRQNGTLLGKNFGTLAAIRAATRDDLMAIKGIKDAIADAIVDGLKERAPLIDGLLEQIKVIEGAAGLPKDVPAAGGVLSGQSFLFTGALTTCSRSDAQKKVRALGAETPSGVSKSLSYLVVGGDELASGKKSSKIKKAEAQIAKGAALKIISEADFVVLLESVGSAS